MASLRTVCTAIAALSVTFTKEAGGTATPTAYDVEASPGAINAADLPVRIIGLTRGATSSDFARLTGTAADVKVTHAVTELALIERVGLSRVRDEWPDVMRYVDALISVLAANRDIATKCEITNASSSRAVYEYPGASGDFFYGAQTQIQITETG